MGALEDRYNRLHPGEAAQSAAPSSAQPQPAAPSSLDERYNKLHPPQRSETDVTQYQPWDLPPNVSQGEYWGAEARLMGNTVANAAADTAKIYADDWTYGLGTAGLAAAQGADPAVYRAEIDAARQRAGGGAYGIDAMAYLTNPYRWLGTGMQAERLGAAGISKIAPNLSPEKVKFLVKRIGDFVEGGGYTGLQSAGHGDDPGTIATNTATGGILSTAGGTLADYAKEVGPWLRSKWGGFQGKPFTAGTPEGTPQEIAAGAPPGAPPYTPEQAMDANQLNLWRSQSKLTEPPSQADVGNYAEKVYGSDPANWPQALLDLHSAAGKEGAPSTAARIIGHGVAQTAGAAANYMGLGFSPEVAAIAHPALASATEMALPVLGYGGAVAPVKGALSDAYPALTGWRNAPNTPAWRYSDYTP